MYINCLVKALKKKRKNYLFPRSNSDLYYLFELVMTACKFMKALEYILKNLVFFLWSRLRDCCYINHCKSILSTWQMALEIFDIFYEHNVFISQGSACTWLTRSSIPVFAQFRCHAADSRSNLSFYQSWECFSAVTSAVPSPLPDGALRVQKHATRSSLYNSPSAWKRI